MKRLTPEQMFGPSSSPYGLTGRGMTSLGQVPGVPGLGTGNAPNTPATKRQGFMDSVGNLIKNPFLMSLLAQSGYSPVPQSPVGAVGRAMLQGQQIEQSNRRAGIEDELLRARIGLANTQAASGGVGGNVQSTFKGGNGNMWVFTRGSTEPVDTGVPFDSNVKTIQLADGTTVAVDADGNRIGNVISPEEAAAATQRASQTEAAQGLPTELAGVDSQIAKADATIAKINDVFPLIRENTTGTQAAIRGDLPGIFGGDARTLKRAVSSLQANFGFDTLQQMRAASKTGGALGQVSERELDLLINALEAIDVEGDPNVLKKNLQDVILHYENYKRELEVMKNAMREQAGQEPEDVEQPRRRRYNPNTGKIE